ncbi:hypothetical protein CI238_07545, partial [Colletotrichum incanum]
LGPRLLNSWAMLLFRYVSSPAPNLKVVATVEAADATGAAGRLGLVEGLPLVGSEHPGADALVVVHGDGDGDVVLKAGVALERADLDGTVPVDGAVGVLDDKGGQLLVALGGGREVLALGQQTELDALEPGEDEEGGGGGLNVVAGTADVGRVHDQPPAAGLVLGVLQALSKGGEVLGQLGDTGVAAGQQLDDLEEGDGVPADGTGPGQGGGTGHLVGPDSLLLLVKAVVEEVGGVVAGVSVNDVELVDNVVPGGGVLAVEEGGPLSVEGVGHEDAVEPHLVVVVGAAVEEAALRRARVAVQLVADGLGGSLVLLLAGTLVPPEDVVTNAVLVQGVLGRLPVKDATVGEDDAVVDAAAVPVDEGLVLGELDGGLEAVVEDSLGVVEGLLVVDLVLGEGLGGPGQVRASGRGGGSEEENGLHDWLGGQRKSDCVEPREGMTVVVREASVRPDLSRQDLQGWLRLGRRALFIGIQIGTKPVRHHHLERGRIFQRGHPLTGIWD